MKDMILTFPSGEFTHTELAAANGKTNQQVWTAYQKAIKDGVIVSAGERKGSSGKPSKVWKRADGVPMPVITVPKIQSETRVNRVPKAEPIVNVAIPEIDVVIEAVIAAKAEVVELAEVKPAAAPFEIEMGTPPATPVMPTVVHNKTFQVAEIEDVCPFCKTKLLSIGTGGNVRVWCPINDLSVCSSSENPYGCANNVKAAVEVLHDKFFKHRV